MILKDIDGTKWREESNDVNDLIIKREVTGDVRPEVNTISCHKFLTLSSG